MSRRLLRATATVGGGTMTSRLLGFTRDVVLATTFGAGSGFDAFLVAFKIPNFSRRLFAEGAFSLAFIPVLTEYKVQRSQQEVRELIGRISGTLGVVLLLLTLVVLVAAPLIIALFAPGFVGEPEKFEMATGMLRVTFPYLLLISLTALAAAVMNCYQRFAIPAYTPAWLNISLISAAFWLVPLFDEPVMGLAWGVCIAGVAQLAFQLPTMRSLGLLVLPSWGWRYQGVQRIIKLMLPVIFGASVAQISLLFDTIIASFLRDGSISWLYYSDRLMEFPLGVFGIALATVILPYLSERHAESDSMGFSHAIDWALRWVIVIGLPSSVGLLMLSEPILTTLFQYNAFTPGDVEMAALSLRAYSLGLLGFFLVKVLAPGYFSRQDSKTPVRIGIIAVGVNMALNLLFVVPMVLFEFQGPHAGLALATALGAFVNAYLLYRGLRHGGVYAPGKGWGRLWAQVLVANVAMGLLIYFTAGTGEEWFAMELVERAMRLLGLVLGAGGLYFVVLYGCGFRISGLNAVKDVG